MRRSQIFCCFAACVAAGVVSYAGYAADGRHAERKAAPIEIGKARQRTRALPPSILNMSGFSAQSNKQIWQDHRGLDNLIDPDESEGP